MILDRKSSKTEIFIKNDQGGRDGIQTHLSDY